MKIFFVDSFTTEKFKGNPAAIAIPEQELDPVLMQQIATEIGFSETAFIRPLEDNSYTIRFFTPKIEIPLCGHATLAAAHIIFNSTACKSLQFITASELSLHIQKTGSEIRMQFPVYDTEAVDVNPKMLQALGITEMVDKRYSPNNKIILLEIQTAAALAQLAPDFAALIKTHSGINGVLVTAVSEDPAYDFQYRYFWPWAGTNEDPVTGGVQTFLAPYWAKKWNKTKLKAHQASLRTGAMALELLNNKVYISGEAVTVLQGEFIL